MTWRYFAERSRYAGRAVLTVAAALLFTTCASERSTTPKDVSHVLYLGADEPGTIYTVDTDSFAVIDSLPGIGTTQFMVSSSDGKYLFVSCDHPTLGRSVLKISVATKSIMAHQPSIALFPPQLLDHGKLLLTYLDKRRILDAATLEPVSEIPDSLLPLPSIGAVTEVLARAVGGERYYLYDIITGTVRGGYAPHFLDGTYFPPQFGYVYVARLHAPTSRVSLLVDTPRGSFIILGDIITGQTLLQHRLAYPFGDVAFSDDGELMAVSDPSWPLYWDTPITIDIFDFRTLTHMKRLNSTVDFPLETCDRLLFVPNSHTLVAAPQLHWGFQVQVIDLETESIRVTKYLPYMGTPIGGIVLGPALN